MMTRAMRMAQVRARADYTDRELLEQAVRWHCVDPVIAWQFREAWAIRCIEGKEVEDGVVSSG